MSVKLAYITDVSLLFTCKKERISLLSEKFFFASLGKQLEGIFSEAVIAMRIIIRICLKQCYLEILNEQCAR